MPGSSSPTDPQATDETRDGSNLRGSRVLVTGAGGFIGSHLVERLVRLGCRVRAFAHYNSRGDWGLLEQLPPEVLSQVEVVLGDIRDGERIHEAVRGCEVVFHLAALIGVPYSYEAPRSYVDVNVGGTLNLLEASRRHGVERLVHTSTSEVYGTAQTIPMDESHPLCPQSPYAATKVGADKLVESYHRTFALPAIIIRPFNTYGPRQSARAVVPTILGQALAGVEVRLGTTSTVRDLTYVEDTVEGLIRGASRGKVGAVYNLGTGVGVSIEDLVREVGELLGRSLRIAYDPHRVRPEKSEVHCLVSDNGRARGELDWAPRVSLRAGLERVARWMEGRRQDYKVGLYAR